MYREASNNRLNASDALESFETDLKPLSRKLAAKL